MEDDEILKLAHRMAWKYKHSYDESETDTYTFNGMCMINYAKKIIEESGIDKLQKELSIAMGIVE